MPSDSEVSLPVFSLQAVWADDDDDEAAAASSSSAPTCSRGTHKWRRACELLAAQVVRERAAGNVLSASMASPLARGSLPLGSSWTRHRS